MAVNLGVSAEGALSPRRVFRSLLLITFNPSFTSAEPGPGEEWLVTDDFSLLGAAERALSTGRHRAGEGGSRPQVGWSH